MLAWAYRRVRGREGLGVGDPLLLGAGGAWVGWIGLPSVLLWASLAGLSVAAGALAVRRRLSGSDRLPFGAFLAVGLWLTWLYGPLGLT
ncbi:Type 4 prepilin-like proteins leader peptide-processing enzyme [compost metagenome]